MTVNVFDKNFTYFGSFKVKFITKVLAEIT